MTLWTIRSATRPWPRRRRRRLFGLVVVVLLAQMAVAMTQTAREQTPTIDEPVYLGAAVSYLHERSLRYNPEHPPLGKLIMAAGLAFAKVRIEPGFAGSQTALGRDVLYRWGNDPARLLFLARLPMIVLTLGFGLVAWGFARDLTGAAGGLVALGLYAFSPQLIAHGSLATLDVTAAGFLLTSVWLLWRARRRPWPWYLPLAGVALGAAVATRMSALAAVPVLLPLAVVSVRRSRRGGGAGRPRPLVRGVVAAGAVGLIALAVVWATYLAVDPHLRWTTPAQVPELDGLRGQVVDGLPVPAPFRDGMRIQFGFEDGGFSGFLFGRGYYGSVWYYLPAALLVKTPLATLFLWLAGAVAVLRVRRLRPAAAYLLLPAAVLLAAAMASSRDLGVRYAIFLPMFLAVAAAAVTTVRPPEVRARIARVLPPARVVAPVLVSVLVLLVAGSSLRAYPYYLAYGNEAFGGPARTHLHLHDSNVDWGQDLGRLAEHLREHYPGQRVWLVYKGSGVPSSYGIDAANPVKADPARVRGLLVVSRSSAARAEGRLAHLIATSRPIDQVGHSITIYRRDPPPDPSPVS